MPETSKDTAPQPDHRNGPVGVSPFVPAVVSPSTGVAAPRPKNHTAPAMSGVVPSARNSSAPSTPFKVLMFTSAMPEPGIVAKMFVPEAARFEARIWP